MRGCFVSGTGTGVGKTLFARALTLSLRASGLRVAALKPVETGCVPRPQDAEELARAAGTLALAHAPGFYRAVPPVAPAAVALLGGTPPPSVAQLTCAVRRAAQAADVCVVEGAGGLLVPLDAECTMADLALALQLPVVLVAADGLGVLSHVLTAWEAAVRRSIAVGAVVLSQAESGGSDPSRAHNAQLLSERLPVPVHVLGAAPQKDGALCDFALGLPWLRGLVGPGIRPSAATPHG